jgi:hypothetical protein
MEQGVGTQTMMMKDVLVDHEILELQSVANRLLMNSSLAALSLCVELLAGLLDLCADALLE